MTTPGYVWPDPNSDGWIDAWNGWYATEGEARFFAQPAVREGRDWILVHGEALIDEAEMERRASV